MYRSGFIAFRAMLVARNLEREQNKIDEAGMVDFSRQIVALAPTSARPSHLHIGN